VDSPQSYWPRFTEEFHRRETTAVYGALATCGLVGQRTQKSLATAFADKEKWIYAFAVPERAILFAYGIFAWGMKEWEYTIDHAAVTDVIDAAETALGQAEGRSEAIGSHADLPAVELIMTLAHSLKPCMALEDTLYNSSLLAFNRLVNDIVEENEKLEAALLGEELKSLDKSIRSCLGDTVQTQLHFYKSLTYFGKTALRYRNGDTVEPTTHKEAIRQLDSAHKALIDIGPDVLASELLPYRRVLIAFRDRLKLPDIRFNDVKVVYLYPFTVDALSGADIYDKLVSKIYGAQAGRDGREESLSPRPRTLAGVAPRSIDEADLTDLWKWRGFRPPLHNDFDSPDYDAVDVEMPDLVVKPEDGPELRGYRVKIRITTLGNHYVRIEKGLKNPKSYEINQGLRRVCNLMSDLGVTSADAEKSQRWPNLTEYAKSTVRDLLQLFDSDLPDSAKRMEEEILSDIDVRFHVLLEVRSASVGLPNGDRRDATEEDIKRSAAPLLLQPLTRLAIAPEEWVCYRTAKWTNLLHRDSFADDFAVGTNSTTVLSMPASPDWFYNSYEECIELVVSFSSLVAQWAHEIRENHEYTRGRMQPGDDHRREIEEKERQEAKRHQSVKFAEVRRGLHDKMVDIRKRRAFLTPSELVGSGHLRAFMENLFDVARISDLLKEVDAQLGIAELVHDRAVEHQRRLNADQQRALEKERDERVRNFGKIQQNLLLFIGFFALAGVVQLFEQELWGDKQRVYDNSFHPWWNFGLTVAGWLVMVAGAWWWLQRRQKMLDEPTTPEPHESTAQSRSEPFVALNPAFDGWEASDTSTETGSTASADLYAD
jgi:hypothetical protein